MNTPGTWERGHLVFDPARPGAFVVRVGGTDQSYLDPADPTHLEFDYLARLADLIDGWRPPPTRIRALHVGGAGMSLPRWLAATRPTSAQVVLEPDAALVAEVRAAFPLPPHSGIKVREVDGRRGYQGVRDDSRDLIVVDAFAGARVPADLTTVEAFAELARIADDGALVCLNLGDRAPFAYSRRVAAGLRACFAHVLVAAQPATWRGRRYGNVLLAASDAAFPDDAERRLGADQFGYRAHLGRRFRSWLGGAAPFTDADASESPPPDEGSGRWIV